MQEGPMKLREAEEMREPVEVREDIIHGQRVEVKVYPYNRARKKREVTASFSLYSRAGAAIPLAAILYGDASNDNREGYS